MQQIFGVETREIKECGWKEKRRNKEVDGNEEEEETRTKVTGKKMKKN